MENKPKDLIENNDENKKSQELEIQNEIYLIDVRLQEVDVMLERYEDVLLEKEEHILSSEELEELETEYFELKQKKKQLSKKLKKSRWDLIPVWMGIYAVFQFIFSFFIIQMQISFNFAFWLSFEVFQISKIWLFYLFLFLIPFFSLLASLIILLKIKNKEKKKIFGIIYIIQGVETLVSIILMIVSLTK